ncbi:MAG: hypothetical protein IPP71_11990 [Bacteroidetes bacterium]|nr:hypothetical protein [Bacteroidota bacterium]
MKSTILILGLSLLSFYSFICNAQNRGNIWCFGDSAGIDFNNGAVPINSSLNTRGSCVSYCDTSGQLILYASTGWADIFTIFPFSTQIFNSSDSLVLNGDFHSRGQLV